MARMPVRRLYIDQLRTAMAKLFPERLWSSIGVHGNSQWTPARLLAALVVMSWDEAPTLAARFDKARDLLQRWFPEWTVPTSYAGYVVALRRWLPEIVLRVRERLQERARTSCEKSWKTGRWVVFAVDGSRFECPRTTANEKVLKCAGKERTAPQIFNTTLIHLPSDTLWDFRTGPGTDSERRHLEDMLAGLPPDSLVTADAGFIGYDLCQRLCAAGVHFLLRVASNACLLTLDGVGLVEVNGSEVWLWPRDQARSGAPPHVLRFIQVGQGDKAVFLVTNIISPKDLTPVQASCIYRQRWGIEVTYRTIKQTFDRKTWLSRTPDAALAEHTATLLAVWTLQVLSIEALQKQKHVPQRWSPARSRDIIRRVMRRSLDPTWSINTTLADELGTAVQDPYVRLRTKRARHWPHKKTDPPPKPPRLIPLTPEQIQKGRQLIQQRKS